MDLKSVSIDSAEQIFLDGEELQNVKAYKLEHSAESEGPAELTVTMYVNVGQVCSESPKWSLSADKIAEAVRKCLKEELQAADQSMSQDDIKAYRSIANQKKLSRDGSDQVRKVEKSLLNAMKIISCELGVIIGLLLSIGTRI